MLSSNGKMKKTRLSDFKNIRRGGILAISLDSKTELMMAKLTDGNKDIIIGTQLGQAIKFNEKEIRPMGRQAAGVKGITLGPKDKIIGMVVIGENEKFIFTVSENGYGKKTDSSLYPIRHRGGKGVINLKVNKKIGKAVGMVGISEQELLLITEVGKIIWIQSTKVRSIGRATQGVRIINIADEDRVCSLAKVTES